MAWVRIDDRMPEHPKVAAAGPLALAMQIAGLCYCNRELTDGFIPRAKARTLLDWEIVRADGTCYSIGIAQGMAGDDVSSDWVIDLLVETGMWEEVPGGYLIHDYSDYQPTRAQVKSTQTSKSKAGKEGARSRWHGKTKAEPIAEAMAEPVAPAIDRAIANGWQDVWQNDAPNPNPNIESASPNAQARARPSQFDRIHELAAAYREGLGIPETDAGWNTGGNMQAAAQADQIAAQEITADEIRGATAWLLDSWRHDGARPIKGATPRLVTHVINAIQGWRDDGSPSIAEIKQRRAATAATSKPRAPVPIRDKVIQTDAFEAF
jgi:hypothetical protein